MWEAHIATLLLLEAQENMVQSYIEQKGRTLCLPMALRAQRLFLAAHPNDLNATSVACQSLFDASVFLGSSSPSTYDSVLVRCINGSHVLSLVGAQGCWELKTYDTRSTSSSSPSFPGLRGGPILVVDDRNTHAQSERTLTLTLWLADQLPLSCLS